MEQLGQQTFDNYKVSDGLNNDAASGTLSAILDGRMRYETMQVDFTLGTHCWGRQHSDDLEDIEDCNYAISDIEINDEEMHPLYTEVGTVPMLNGRDFELLRINGEAVVIGSGFFGIVYLGKNVHTNEVVAIKAFGKKPVQNQLKEIIREALFQMTIRKKSKWCFTPQVLGMLSFIDSETPSGFHPFMLVMEHLSVMPHMEKPMKLSLQDAQDLHQVGVDLLRKRDWALICKQLIEITEELSEMNISHLDLHAGNILLVIEGNNSQNNLSVNVKIIDFGKCEFVTGNNTVSLSGFDRVLEPMDGEELSVLKAPLPTTDLYSVSYLIIQIQLCVLKWVKSAAIIQTFRDQPFMHRWDHNTLKAELGKVQPTLFH